MTRTLAQPAMRRNVAIAVVVVVAHAVALWALNTGLLRRAAEVVVPVQMISELVTPAPPKVEPPAPPAPPVARPKPPQPVARKKPTPPSPVPRQVAPALPPAPNAPVAALEPQPPAPSVVAQAPAEPAPAAVQAPAPARVELPSTTADYLQNPPPRYPPVSRRAGEQGVVIVRVLIGADGTAKEAELRKSSGFDRLDRAALETVRKWRYVPGKRAGVPETMWFNVPINFVLE